MEEVSKGRMHMINNNSTYNTSDKIFLPITFLRFKTENGTDDIVKGGLEVKLSEDGQTLDIFSDQKPKIFNEYHLMQYLGLSDANDSELKEILY